MSRYIISSRALAHPANLCLFGETITTHYAYDCSAMADRVTQGSLVGRPYGGVSVLINKNSSGDEIANVNFLTTISHTRMPTSKYRKRDKPTSFNKLDDR